MTLREVINESRNKIYAEVAEIQTEKDLDLIISRIDGIDDRIDRLEAEFIGLKMDGTAADDRIDKLERDIPYRVSSTGE